MQLDKIIRENRGLVISSCILLACILGVLFGVVPLARKTLALQSEITALSTDVDSMRNKITVLQTLDENTLRGNVQTLLSAVPSELSAGTLFGVVDGLAAQTGVSIISLSLAKTGSIATTSAARLTADEKSIGTNISTFTLNMTGSFDQIRTFVAQSTSIRRFVRIRKLDITSVPSGVSANLSMEAFWAPIPSSIGSINQPVTALAAADTDVINKISGMQLLTGSLVSPLPSTGTKTDPFSL